MLLVLEPQNFFCDSTEDRCDGEADDDPDSQKYGYPHGYPHPYRHRLQCIGSHAKNLEFVSAAYSTIR